MSEASWASTGATAAWSAHVVHDHVPSSGGSRARRGVEPSRGTDDRERRKTTAALEAIAHSSSQSGPDDNAVSVRRGVSDIDEIVAEPSPPRWTRPSARLPRGCCERGYGFCAQRSSASPRTKRRSSTIQQGERRGPIGPHGRSHRDGASARGSKATSHGHAEIHVLDRHARRRRWPRPGVPRGRQ